MWSTFGNSAVYALVIAVISLEAISATRYVDLDPEQIMRELEQYDLQDARGATFDPEVYDSVLEEFSRFVRDGRGSAQHDGDSTKYNANQKVPPIIQTQQKLEGKAANSRDVTQRGQQDKERRSPLSIFH